MVSEQQCPQCDKCYGVVCEYHDRLFWLSNGLEYYMGMEHHSERVVSLILEDYRLVLTLFQEQFGKEVLHK